MFKNIVNHNIIIEYKLLTSLYDTQVRVCNMNENNVYNFTFLNQLIQKNKEIRLEHDIILEEVEKERFSEGIVLDKNAIVIDGNGYSIDAQGMTRIFKVTGSEIIIKNITFMNGYSEDSGAAIANAGSIKIYNSTFTDNMADVDGGAIYNDIGGKIDIEDSEFTNNNSQTDGGAIFNWGELTVKSTLIEDNISWKDAGAIHNGGRTHKSSVLNDIKYIEEDIDLSNVKLAIEDSIICQNTGSHSCGGIMNWGILNVEKSILEKNITSGRGGAISNQGTGIVNLNDIDIISNRANFTGGAIQNQKNGIITLTDSRIEKNETRGRGGTITNRGMIVVNKSKFNYNIAEPNGGVIYNSGQTDINESLFGFNRAYRKGGIIINSGHVNVNNSVFKCNDADYLGESIYNIKGITTLTDTKVVNEEDITEENPMRTIYNKKGSIIMQDTKLSTMQIYIHQ